MGLTERIRNFINEQRAAVFLATLEELSWELGDMGVVDLKDLDRIEVEIFNSLPQKTADLEDSCSMSDLDWAFGFARCLSEFATPGDAVIVRTPPTEYKPVLERALEMYGFTPIYV